MNRDFWVDAAERAVRAFAWAVLSVLIVGDGLMDAFTVDWSGALGVGLGAGVASFLASLAAAKLGNEGTASLTDATVPTSDYEALRRGLGDAGLSGGPS